jgi:hypothetical protein
LKIVLLAEGKTETALSDVLKGFLDARAIREEMPKVKLVTKRLDPGFPDPGRIQDQVARSLRDPDVVCVIGLIDVYPNFTSAEEAKLFLRRAVGQQPRFHAHAAQFETEAWLLPYWDEICRRLRVQRQAPGANPEAVNLEHPPSRHLSELFRLARRSYNKPTDARAILERNGLVVAARQCRELRSLLNTLLTCAGLTPL